MRKTTFAALALCAVATLAARAADDPEPADAKAELKKLKGTWTVTKLIRKGKEPKARLGLTFTFDGDKQLTTVTGVAEGGGEVEVTESFQVKIDAKKRPHTITLTRTGGKRPISQAGVYKVENGRLYLAPGRAAKGAKAATAPKDFSGDSGPVYVMKREKGGK